MSIAYFIWICFSLLAAAFNLIKVAKNGIHRKATGRHVNWTKVKKQRASHPGVGFFRVSFVTFFVWKLCHSLGHVAEPSIANNSKYVRGIACCFRFLYGALISVPLCIPTLVTSHWPFNDATCQFQGYIVMALVAASVHTLALMAVNRYFRIVKPSKYRRYLTKKKTMMMLLVSWFYSICCPLPYFLSGHKTVFLASKFFCFVPIDNNIFTAYGIPLYIGIPTIIIVYCYLSIFKTVRTHNNNIQFSRNPVSAANVEEIKVMRTLFVMVVFFNLCWIPILLIDIVDSIQTR